jgi:hypothetical protein
MDLERSWPRTGTPPDPERRICLRSVASSLISARAVACDCPLSAADDNDQRVVSRGSPWKIGGGGDDGSSGGSQGRYGEAGRSPLSRANSPSCAHPHTCASPRRASRHHCWCPDRDDRRSPRCARGRQNLELFTPLLRAGRTGGHRQGFLECHDRRPAGGSGGRRNCS